MSSSDVERYMAPALAARGFRLDGIDAELVYGERPAWAVFYRGQDCKLQICWSEREGGADFMLAQLDAPNEFGLGNPSKTWKFMLALSDAPDSLGPPPLGKGDGELWAWRNQLFAIHFEPARTALLSRDRPR